jgi:hypothetical protein
MPVAGEALHIEPHVCGAPAHPLLELRRFIHDLLGNQVSKRVLVPALRRRPVGRYHLVASFMAVTY